MQRPIESLYLEPCCIKKHVGGFLERNQPTCFFSYSDWALPELLEILSLHIPKSELTVCLPTASKEVVQKLVYLLNDLRSVSQVNLLTSTPADQSPLSGLKEKSIFRLARHSMGFRMIALKNENRQVVVTGSFNQTPMQLGCELQQFILCTDPDTYRDTLTVLESVFKLHSDK